MFRTLIYPSSEACDSAVELPHLSFCSHNTDTTKTQPRQISNTQRTESKTTDVVIQQHSRKLLMMDILMSETCWVQKKWNKIASDIKLVFYSSTTTMMHGPINISINIYSLTLVLGGVGGQRYTPAALHPWRETQYPFYSSLGGPRSRSRRMRKVSSPPGFDPRIFQPLTGRYTDCTVPARC